ncbi:redoxin domain-containing protein [Marivirga harenae]|uniref:TlpA family protein disulfide reductase n=1 Tax=Marivirga harenae TaxID=2010992 RepID=UPI0026DF2C2D|nr:redoxin domain-containing protein [Marivirga harenae]WKV11771.1 redoxin family protein [Marivirga harenae]|tara:strand:+ start:10285 stop:10857 length:573 start_codon:yes stop_codon:yes gene_type:complete
MSKKINWRKEAISWGVMIAIFGTLYITGWHAPVMGKIQSWLLATHLITPSIENIEIESFNFDGELITPNGERISYAQLQNKTIFINYWATWCPPCLGEMPHIEKLYQQLKDNHDIAFLMISKDNDFNKAIKFKEKKEYELPIYQELRSPVQLQSQTLPTTFVIKQGKIVFRKEGMSNFNTEEFRDFLSKN